MDLGQHQERITHSWRWFKVRVEGLLSLPPQVVYRPTEDGGMVRDAIPATRLGMALMPDQTP